MSKQEIIELFNLIKSEYRNFMDEETDTEVKLNLWHLSLKNIQKELAVTAFHQHCISNEGQFAPSLHHITKQINKFVCVNKNILTADKSWEIILDAVRDYGYYNAESAIESFEPEIRKALKPIGFRNICHCDISKLNFLKKSFIENFEKIQNDESYKKNINYGRLEND